MPRVTFRPSGSAAEVAPGADLLDAARAAGVDIHTPCGGRGTCGRCRVTIDGPAEDLAGLSPDRVPVNEFLACRCRVGGGDISVDVPDSAVLPPDRDDDAALAESVLSSLREGFSGPPLAELVPITIGTPGTDDGLGDVDRLARALGRGFADDPGFHISIDALRELPDLLRSGGFTLDAVVAGAEDRVAAIRPRGAAPLLGVAVDLGTTTVSALLIDMSSGRVLAAASGYNSQIACGLDVISRINYARAPGHAADLRRRALATINSLVRRCCATAGHDAASVMAAAVSGNSVMTAMLIGVTAEHLRLEPYAPPVLSLHTLEARDAGIDIHPHAPVHLSPGVGSWVGGDITAGLLATPVARGAGGTVLFIDAGTNGEIVLAGPDFALACACSAGPAFEGGGIDCGMRASNGAVDGVEVDASGAARLSVIGGGEARGICGSGIIDLVAGFFRAGVLDGAGKFAGPVRPAALRERGRRAEYLLADGPGGAVTVSEIDIENLMRAKAAVYSAAELLLSHAGMSFGDVDSVLIAGGFGRSLNVERAVTIGLLPDVPRGRFSYLGNTSLAGTALVLLHGGCRDLQRDFARHMTYINLSSDPSYMDHYTAALFLPHTDRTLFPSVVR